ncbi:MAG: glycosyltransferase family 1 protein [Candidatus Thorarchaeota archaeon]|nr:MAG: glycosyltransferase family 1 protein [Candidatus Thorarchaeota archaeon]
MRIGMVSKFGAPDGLCIRTGAVLKGLVSHNNEVHALTQSKFVEGLPEERIHRFRAVQLNPHFSIDTLSAPKTIAKISRKHNLEVLHIQMNSGSTEFVLPYFKKSIPPLVVTYHLAYAAGGSIYSTLFGIAWKASLFASRKYDEVILVDPSQKQYFIKSGFSEDKLTVVRNGVDTNLFKPGESYLKNEEVTDFVYVGRLSYDKGVHLLLDAFREYHGENPKTRLTVIGDGMLKGQVDTCTDDGSVRWLGAIGHDNIPSVLQKMDAFVIPQNIGGLGLSVMEAMGCGLPVITTAIGETKRLLREDEGILVAPDSVSAVVKGMRVLAEDTKKRQAMGLRCRKKIEKEYSWHNQIGLIEDVYRRAIERAS